MPFFTIIIPTRNRPDLVTCAIRSVLNQTFMDYEVLVSDNSDNANETQDSIKLIPDAIGNPRLKYVRPDRCMNMADHWDFAVRHATGSYVAILTDRFVMRPSALAILAEVIKSNFTGEPDLVEWNVQSSYSELTNIYTVAECTGAVELMDAKEMLVDFVRFSSWSDGNFYFNKLPRGLNCVFKRSLSEQIHEGYGRLFFQNSPDYTSAFMFLAHSEKVLYLDLSLYVSHGDQSGGMKCMIFGMHLLGTDIDPFEDCPLQLDTVFNSVVRDFIAIKKLLYPRMQKIEMSIVGYYLSNYAELIVKESMGSPMDLQALYKLWYQGVAELPSELQKEINLGVIILDKRRPSPFNIWKQKMLRKYGLDKLRDSVRGFQSRYLHQKAGGVFYNNALEAANASDSILRDYIERCNISRSHY